MVLAFPATPFSFFGDDSRVSGVLPLLLLLVEDFWGVVSKLGFFPLVSRFDLLRFGCCASLVSRADELLDSLAVAADELEVAAELESFALAASAAPAFLVLGAAPAAVSPAPSLFAPPDRVWAIRSSRNQRIRVGYLKKPMSEIGDGAVAAGTRYPHDHDGVERDGGSGARGGAEGSTCGGRRVRRQR